METKSVSFHGKVSEFELVHPSKQHIPGKSVIAGEIKLYPSLSGVSYEAGP